MGTLTIDNNQLGLRLEELQNVLKFRSSRAFALKIDADPAYFAKAQKGKGLSESYIDKITDQFKVSRDWLLYGLGDMFTLDNVQTFKDKEKEPDTRISDTYKDKYISLLEKSLEEYKNKISGLEQDIKEIKAGILDLQDVRKTTERNMVNLDELRKNQTTMLNYYLAFQEVVIARLTETPNQARALSRTVGKSFAQKNLEHQ